MISPGTSTSTRKTQRNRSSPASSWTIESLRGMGIKLTELEERRLNASVASWMLSQFLHGEQGALFAAAQVTEAVHSRRQALRRTQVVDEGRHVEVFHRYLETKLEKLYQINDNLFVIIDALMQDSRWDVKFLGMQIMVEGLALGAFGTLHQMTGEPMLKQLLKRSYRTRRATCTTACWRSATTSDELSESERREREDWAFEVAAAHAQPLPVVRGLRGVVRAQAEPQGSGPSSSPSPPVSRSSGKSCSSASCPISARIGLLSDRIRPHYERAGLDAVLRWRIGDPTQRRPDDRRARRRLSALLRPLRRRRSRGVRVDLVAGLTTELLDSAVARRGDGVLHLHRFHDEEHLTG